MREVRGKEDCNMDFLDDMSDMERARYDWWFRRQLKKNIVLGLDFFLLKIDFYNII